MHLTPVLPLSRHSNQYALRQDPQRGTATEKATDETRLAGDLCLQYLGLPSDVGQSKKAVNVTGGQSPHR